MIKVYVVIVGLFSMIPPKQATNGPAAALLLRADSEISTMSGGHIPRHHAIVYFRPKDYGEDETAQWRFDGENLQFGDPGRSPDFDKNDFVDLTKVVGSSVKLAAGCNDANHEKLCRVGGLPALIGRISFHGGKIEPLNVRDRSLLDGSVFISREPFDLYDFRVARPGGERSAHITTAPTAVVYSTEVDPDKALEVLGRKIPLGLAKREKCKELGSPDGEDCIRIVILNSQFSDSQHSQGELQPFPTDTPDFHFDLFYNLLSERNVTRFLPLRRVRPSKRDSDPPESRCVVPFIEE